MVPRARVSGVNHGSGKESAGGGPPKAGVGLCRFDFRSVQSACYAFYYENRPALWLSRYFVKVEESAALDSPPHPLTFVMKAVSQILGHRILE